MSRPTISSTLHPDDSDVLPTLRLHREAPMFVALHLDGPIANFAVLVSRGDYLIALAEQALEAAVQLPHTLSDDDIKRLDGISLRVLALTHPDDTTYADEGLNL